MLALTQNGISRENAYVFTQRNAMKVWDEGGEYRELVLADPDISAALTPEEIERVFDVKHYLRNVDKVFERVFGSK
jgi:adenylosuccinate lyase